jgi:hypothetical protein
MKEWISVVDSIPVKQIECVFYANKYEWWTGMFTPAAMSDSGREVFQYHEHWGDDNYHTVENVICWMELPV